MVFLVINSVLTSPPFLSVSRAARAQASPEGESGSHPKSISCCLSQRRVYARLALAVSLLLSGVARSSNKSQQEKHHPSKNGQTKTAGFNSPAAGLRRASRRGSGTEEQFSGLEAAGHREEKPLVTPRFGVQVTAAGPPCRRSGI